MQVPIKRFSKDLPLPAYKTPGAVAMDCAVREGGTVAPHGIAYFPLNIALHPPKGHWVLMAARSSLHKRGLMMANSIAVFDEDYSGDNDEYKAVLYNFTDQPVEVKAGERITQIVFVPYDKVEWAEIDSLGNPDRGGYGTTGI